MEQTTKTAVPDKLFYKAAEVCQLTDTQPYVLRFWESEFPQLASEKNRSGQKVYRRQDIDLILRIKKLLYEEEYTIAGARKAIEDGLDTVVVPASPSRSKGRHKAAPPEPVEDPEPPKAAKPAPRTSLFEGRERGAETSEDAAVAAEAEASAVGEPRDRALHDNALRTIDELRRELNAAIETRDAARTRNRRLADRLQAVLEP
jgi:DNA-binding transcriptional MerR regulator